MGQLNGICLGGMEPVWCGRHGVWEAWSLSGVLGLRAGSGRFRPSAQPGSHLTGYRPSSRLPCCSIKLARHHCQRLRRLPRLGGRLPAPALYTMGVSGNVMNIFYICGPMRACLGALTRPLAPQLFRVPSQAAGCDARTRAERHNHRSKAA